MWQKIKPFVFFIALSLGVGAFSAFLTRDAMNIYGEIISPAFAPPAILFPIVWTVLYILMGVSAALVYRQKEAMPPAVRDGMVFFGTSLAVNFTWSLIFFNLRAFLFASLWILFLLFLIASTIYYYRKVSPPAAYLQIPYLLWVAFATVLTFAIYHLNG